MDIFFSVVAVAACVLGLALIALYYMNKSVEQTDR